MVVARRNNYCNGRDCTIPRLLSQVKKVLEEGLEPTHLSVPDPKSGASANFAIRATIQIIAELGHLLKT